MVVRSQGTGVVYGRPRREEEHASLLGRGEVVCNAEEEGDGFVIISHRVWLREKGRGRRF